MEAIKSKWRSTIRTAYPFEYNKNEPMEGFEKWKIYVHKELLITVHPAEMLLIQYKKALTNYSLQMNTKKFPKVNDSDGRSRREPTREEMVKGDRIIMGLILLAIIALAIINS